MGKIKYTEAYSELKQIVEEMENSEITIDDLDVKIKRAAELLKICKEKLYETENSVKNVLSEMSSSDEK